MRELRRYESCARVDHFCDRCTRYIQPGERYSAIVYAIERAIMVFKTHADDPFCDISGDFEEHERSSKDVEENNSLRLVA
ncbi:hypothetical protein CMI46_03375 [Candidatus Pacearchaeota archaeon]|nr:hypothetical protein [Candidatus Pacearchaeota archaeon]|tara:strand:- start:4740 stop:4979 length:240 start_codon:yes stop_codon:yes gene_type:complete